MNYELSTLIGLGSGYLLLLFGIAYVTERGLIPQRIVSHPMVYVFSLGVFASVWAYYTSIGNALRDGYGYLANSIGVSLAFLLSPLLLRPLLELTRTYQLSSLADLLSFRYRSPWVGTLTTIVTVIGVTPLISLQIRVVADTADILSPDASPGAVAIGFCIIITVFSLLFGTSPRAGRTRNDGLVMAIAFESLVKLIAFLAVGLFAVFGGFGGFGAMENWLINQPDLLGSLESTNYFGGFHVMALMFFTAAVAMPHMFYATFNENKGQRALAIASWGLPLYLLLLSIPVLPILWAGLQSGSSIQTEYLPVAIGVAYEVPFFTLLAYLGGLSAASGLIIVITLALANMCLNHLILPLSQPAGKHDIYRWLLWRRRILITAVIWSAFLFYSLPNQNIGLEVIGAVAFSATLQFLPATIAILYWPQGNKKGVISGLLAGIAIWLIFLLMPMVLNAGSVTLESLRWDFIAALSLAFNCLTFAVVSLASESSDEERSSADVCTLDTIQRRKRSGLVARSPDEFIRSLSKPLGDETAKREVMQAMQDLDITLDEKRPFAMRQLRGRLEANLSGLLGPSIARELIDSYLPYSVVSGHGSSDLTVIENRIEAYRSNLSGMAADLDSLRRYHRQVLLDLPLGVCSLSSDNEIVMWNKALSELTGLDEGDVLGSQLTELPEPWLSLLQQFIEGDSNHLFKRYLEVEGHKKAVNLHKAVIDSGSDPQSAHEGKIILIEDITETEILEAGLTHSERLASIGRLAAGVAHEIGNPITGIACLAQTIRDEYSQNELHELAEEIIAQTDRTSKILQSLVNFAHSGSSDSETEPEIISIGTCAEEATSLISLDKKSKDVLFEIHCDEDAKILGDPQRLLQVFINLLNNARDASQPNTTISLEAHVREGRVIVTITDQGIGIPDAIRDRIFDPFFTTKEAGEGTGLGLSLVYSIVGEMDGDIDIISPADNSGGSGTRVVLSFPAYK